MDTTALIVLIVAGAVLSIALLGAVVWRQRERQRSRDLRRGFGPEYDRTLEEAGDRRRAEGELSARQERVGKLKLRDLTTEDRERFRSGWADAQSHFVDDPSGALRDSDALIEEVMRARGYPVDDFDQRAADLSVEHGDVIEHYRAAHAVAERPAGKALTEDMRQAMLHYRALFDDMLAVPAARRAS